MKISVLFSFRNEEEVLEELLRRLARVFLESACDYELIFVDDDSSDRSLEILRSHCEKDPRILVIHMAERFGVAPCFAAGFDHASGDAVIMMDADLQDPPELIPQLIQEWQKGAHVVHTRRLVRKGESSGKRAVTAIGYRLWKVLLSADLILDSGDFRLLSREAVDELRKRRGADPFFRALTRSLPFDQVCVDYERDKRFAGETHFSLLRSWDPFRTFVGAILAYAPLSRILLLGIGMFFFLWAILNLFGAGIGGAAWSAGMLILFVLFYSGYKIALIQKVEQPLYRIERVYGFDKR